MGNPFKVGQKVKFLGRDTTKHGGSGGFLDSRGFKAGDIMTVKGVDGDYLDFDETPSRGGCANSHFSRFELVVEPDGPVFVPGQRVRFLDDGKETGMASLGFKKGHILTVKEVGVGDVDGKSVNMVLFCEPRADPDPALGRSPRDVSFGWQTSAFELVKEQEPLFKPEPNPVKDLQDLMAGASRALTDNYIPADLTLPGAERIEVFINGKPVLAAAQRAGTLASSAAWTFGPWRIEWTRPK